MSYSFANQSVICPDCKQHDPIIRKDRIVGPQLFCIERVPDCAFDVGECEQCLGNYEIHYTIERVEKR